MNTPFGSDAPASGAPPTPQISASTGHRTHLRAEEYTAYLSVSLPLDAATLAEIAHTLENWQSPTTLRAFVLDLTACAGSIPATGIDGAAGKGGPESRQGRVRERALTVAQERALAVLARISVPVLGVASGIVPPPGCVLLSFCDLLLAAQDTIFVCEGAARLMYHATPTRLGNTNALSERISAHQAQRQGLVNWLAPAEQLSRERARILELLVNKSATSLALAKRALLIGLAHPNTPDQALEQIGNLYLKTLMATPDAVEGLQAFLEKRPPRWQETLRETTT